MQTAPSLSDTPEHTKLRQSGFLVFDSGEAQAQFGGLSSVVIEQDGGKWHTYRIRWYADGKMQTHTTLYKGAEYAAAVRKACEFMNWLKTKRRNEM